MNASVPERAPEEVAAQAEGVRMDVAADAGRPANAPPMAWYGFLCRFGLWLEALYHALQAGWIFRGGQYYEAEIREMAYAGLPALRARRAALLRERNPSGFAPAGALLANWCDEQKE